MELLLRMKEFNRTKRLNYKNYSLIYLKTINNLSNMSINLNDISILLIKLCLNFENVTINYL